MCGCALFDQQPATTTKHTSKNLMKEMLKEEERKKSELNERKRAIGR